MKARGKRRSGALAHGASYIALARFGSPLQHPPPSLPPSSFSSSSSIDGTTVDLLTVFSTWEELLSHS